MKRGYLSQYFSGVALKRLSPVEADFQASNQHEFNGSAEIESLLGDADRKNIPTRFMWVGQDQDQSEAESGFLSWYDARRAHPKRSEYRLYYEGNAVTRKMVAGDAFFLAARQDSTALAIFTPADSTAYNQLIWLFGIDSELQESFDFTPIEGNRDAELGFVSRSVLEALEIEPDEPEAGHLDSLVEPFGVKMPKAAVLSELARTSVGTEIAIQDPDKAIIDWMERETLLFRRIERKQVAKRIAEGFGQQGAEDVDGFIKFSLSVQNRRKARAGLALESHIEVVLEANNVGFVRGAISENNNRPDFLFPSAEAYHDPEFPSARLLMLGAKSTLKDRWRQVLSEAQRIEEKHLLTLEPAISEKQTAEMKAKKLQLVLPRSIHTSYHTNQQSWLMSVRDFIELVKSRNP
ncbi:restriction endonuclease [Altererythrobacter halimionae]|uniref:Restriction endonuclease n=2 Tax=Alteriqipengyuania halimionae TaxID=1926630 RepID=A0A6I4U6K2_9SPHN|nr:restriction endonuclease [Alteriqipengyuania halimionae]